MNKRLEKLNYFQIYIVVLFTLFIIFPTNHHLTDSYDYAASVRYGNKLFAPHHLLYNITNYLIYKTFNLIITDIDIIRLMQYVNTFFALLSTCLFYKITNKYLGNKTYARVLTMFAISTFGFVRFSTEVEAFILPIFISLIATYFYLEYLQLRTRKFALITGLFASLACLYHQIHLFWGIGFFIGFLMSKDIKAVLIYLLPTPLVLVAYGLVLVFYNHTTFSPENLLNFLANYYYSENADTSVTVSNLIITSITFVRTFFQVHGSILVQLKLYSWSILIAIISLVLLSVGAFRLLKQFKLKSIQKPDIFALTCIFIFTLQLGFAFFSHGNSEFMVMLPFVLAMFLPRLIPIEAKTIQLITLGMIVWNLGFGVIPNHFIDYQNNDELVDHIKKHPNDYFILKENYLISSKYYYNYGIDSYDKIIGLDHKFSRLTISDSTRFYTDIFTKQTPVGRLEFTTSFDTSKLQFIKHTYRINTTMGGFFIDEVRLK